MNYMIYTKIKQDDREEYIYMFPKNVSVTPEYTKGQSCAGMFGGTFTPHIDPLSTLDQETLDKAEFKRMLDRALYSSMAIFLKKSASSPAFFVPLAEELRCF